MGYIGLPTALVAAEHDFEVVGFDIDADRVAKINNGDPVIEEPEISNKLTTILTKKKFKASTKLESADYFVVAVPTPFKDQHKADLSYVWKAIDSLSTVLKKGDTVIMESTVPVGITNQCAAYLEKKTQLKAGEDFFVVHSPERVLPGNIFHELVHNARVIGGINQESVDMALGFYKAFVKAPLYLTNATTAEMVKLVENSSRDVAIAFANQVAAMAYKCGLDPFEVIELANKHPRVSILNPSCGVGGHCIAVDPWFLIETFPAQTQLLQTARAVNDAKPHEVVKITKKSLETLRITKSEPTLVILGLTYKPNIDDLRESPALTIAQDLIATVQARVLVVEPFVHDDIVYQRTGRNNTPLMKSLQEADIVLCLVKHKPFSIIEKHQLENKVVLDFCGLFHEQKNIIQQNTYLFWPASNTTIQPIIDYVQEETV